MASRVGNYLLFETLGEGAFGKVKLGVHEETGEQVAVKIMDKKDIKAQEMTMNVRREIAIMKALKHRNIVNLRQVLTSQSKLYIVMDLVTGGELFTKILKEGKLPEDTARHYFQQLVDGIEYCHKRGVCHRDLKPENLLIDETTGELKITDFGLSAMKGASTTEELLHTQCGSPNYCAPEIIARHKEGYNGNKVDAWSCGIILYALLAGYLPFYDENTKRLYKMIQQEDVKFPKKFPPNAKDLILKLLHKNPEQRFTLNDVKKHHWFLIGYTNPDSVNAKDTANLNASSTPSNTNATPSSGTGSGSGRRKPRREGRHARKRSVDTVPRGATRDVPRKKSSDKPSNTDEQPSSHPPTHPHTIYQQQQQQQHYHQHPSPHQLHPSSPTSTLTSPNHPVPPALIDSPRYMPSAHRPPASPHVPPSTPPQQTHVPHTPPPTTPILPASLHHHHSSPITAPNPPPIPPPPPAPPLRHHTTAPISSTPPPPPPPPPPVPPPSLATATTSTPTATSRPAPPQTVPPVPPYPGPPSYPHSGSNNNSADRLNHTSNNRTREKSSLSSSAATDDHHHYPNSTNLVDSSNHNHVPRFPPPPLPPNTNTNNIKSSPIPIKNSPNPAKEDNTATSHPYYHQQHQPQYQYQQKAPNTSVPTDGPSSLPHMPFNVQVHMENSLDSSRSRHPTHTRSASSDWNFSQATPPPPHQQPRTAPKWANPPPPPPYAPASNSTPSTAPANEPPAMSDRLPMSSNTGGTGISESGVAGMSVMERRKLMYTNAAAASSAVDSSSNNSRLMMRRGPSAVRFGDRSEIAPTKPLDSDNDTSKNNEQDNDGDNDDERSRNDQQESALANAAAEMNMDEEAPLKDRLAAAVARYKRIFRLGRQIGITASPSFSSNKNHMPGISSSVGSTITSTSTSSNTNNTSKMTTPSSSSSEPMNSNTSQRMEEMKRSPSRHTDFFSRAKAITGAWGIILSQELEEDSDSEDERPIVTEAELKAFSRLLDFWDNRRASANATNGGVAAEVILDDEESSPLTEQDVANIQSLLHKLEPKPVEDEVKEVESVADTMSSLSKNTASAASGLGTNLSKSGRESIEELKQKDGNRNGDDDADDDASEMQKSATMVKHDSIGHDDDDAEGEEAESEAVAETEKETKQVEKNEEKSLTTAKAGAGAINTKMDASGQSGSGIGSTTNGVGLAALVPTDNNSNSNATKGEESKSVEQGNANNNTNNSNDDSSNSNERERHSLTLRNPINSSNATTTTTSTNNAASTATASSVTAITTSKKTAATTGPPVYPSSSGGGGSSSSVGRGIVGFGKKTSDVNENGKGRTGDLYKNNWDGESVIRNNNNNNSNTKDQGASSSLISGPKRKSSVNASDTLGISGGLGLKSGHRHSGASAGSSNSDARKTTSLLGRDSGRMNSGTGSGSQQQPDGGVGIAGLGANGLGATSSSSPTSASGAGAGAGASSSGKKRVQHNHNIHSRQPSRDDHATRGLFAFNMFNRRKSIAMTSFDTELSPDDCLMEIGKILVSMGCHVIVKKGENKMKCEAPIKQETLKISITCTEENNVSKVHLKKGRKDKSQVEAKEFYEFFQVVHARFHERVESFEPNT